ncbi:DUF2975 domain-containing protein [Clostridium sp. CM028]|uniref:DUF2975 domain-containing protein n=1 Tax=unclassified Clostridium TaxID=2614128 RepID=UPI001C0AD64F|nr:MULTISPECIES: DUF2975 domain-containing protein [unclassified Clostridium]MBU3092421.1 DUF2975 domain-containing protein [Clostridium sp. CF011]MBW9146049.1 DUF2975 domain-containing protein [Clostridium sp. CM027]MBW9150291.1 DUF2975 domain-containing protein [Clostridium sp. CM028]UVE39518.1 DUF2975 domain-containing protein [Clostridium sp. CM027]WAG68432.1 DUF2975 domain-containing protein [Clostridium sp. CF011]
MKYYGKTSLSSLLKLMLDGLIVIGFIVYLLILRKALVAEQVNLLNFKNIITCVLFVLGGFALLCIMYYLRCIMNSLVKANPFVWKNVESLKIVAASCFIIAACYVLNFFINNQYLNLKLIEIDAKGIHTDIEFIIFFFAGCFTLVLSKVFKQAIEVKEENDFTV